MKTTFLSFLSILIMLGNARAQCSETQTPRMLLIGDSWAAFMHADQSLNHALRNAGHSDKKYVSSVVVAENGADTWDFLDQEKQTAIQDIIDANPEIDMIHLSIGGNDVLGDWHTSFSQHQTDSLEQEVAGRLEEIIEFLKSTRPGIRIFWAGYAYPNFGEVIEDIAPAQSLHPFFSLWDEMGQPTFIQLNQILNEFSDSVAAYAASEPQLDFVPAQGILQHVYGQTTPLGIAPGGSYPAFDAPLPLGYPDYPSPKETMRPYGFFTDCFHLSADAYLTMMSYQTQKFYQKFFMDDLYLLSDGGDKDGSVSSAGDVSQTIRFGEDSGNEIAAALTFDTQQMTDTTLSGASIFLRRESISGSDPMAGNDIQIKAISGTFGTSEVVEAVDFSAAGDVHVDACRFGSNEDGHWIRLDLPASVLGLINNQSQTQFLISVPGFSGGTITFSDASDPELAPVLNLEYGPTPPSSVHDSEGLAGLSIYPVPTTGPLTIDVDPRIIDRIEVFNMMGEMVLLPANSNQIDLSVLPVGPYILRVTTTKGVSTRRIIKR